VVQFANVQIIHAQAVTRAYTADKTLQRGMIVRITDKDKNKVEALTFKVADKMLGVVVAANDAPVTLTSGDTTHQQVFVASNGRYNVLVSDQGGKIALNDYLTISSLEGIAMKADLSQTIVVGKALATFDGNSKLSSTVTVKNSAGREVKVGIGVIPVEINISHNPLQDTAATLIPGLKYLSAGARVISARDVSPIRLYVSVFLLLVISAVAGGILFSGVRSAVMSIGRNPLAKQSILKGLSQIILISVIVFIIGVIGVYLILKL
jgi:hypothetical protein